MFFLFIAYKWKTNIRGIENNYTNEKYQGYEIMSQERLVSSINESKPVKEKNFDDARIEKVINQFNELRDRLFKLKIKVIRKDLYKMEIKKKEEIEKKHS